MTTIEKIEKMKTSFPDVILKLADDVIEGNISAAQLQIFLRQAKDVIDMAEKAIKPSLITESDYKDGINVSGYNFKVRRGAGRHSYDHIPAWCELKTKITDLEEKSKLAQKMYLRGDQYVTDEGELIPPSVYVSYDDSVVMTKIKGAL